MITKTFITTCCLLLAILTIQAQQVTSFRGANKKWGFKDQTGKEIIPPNYDKVQDFSEGMASVSIGFKLFVNYGKWGYVDSTGKEVVEVKYEFAGDFSQGLGVVNTGGTYSNGLAVVIGGKWSYVNKSGKEVLALKDKDIEWASDFETGGLAVVGTGYSKFSPIFGLIDKKGKVVTPMKYISIWSAFDGLRKIRIGDKFGYVSATTGKEIIAANYDEADNFENGKAKVKKDGREFYIDKTGKEVK